MILSLAVVVNTVAIVFIVLDLLRIERTHAEKNRLLDVQLAEARQLAKMLQAQKDVLDSRLRTLHDLIVKARIPVNA